MSSTEHNQSVDNFQHLRITASLSLINIDIILVCRPHFTSKLDTPEPFTNRHVDKGSVGPRPMLHLIHNVDD